MQKLTYLCSIPVFCVCAAQKATCLENTSEITRGLSYHGLFVGVAVCIRFTLPSSN